MNQSVYAQEITIQPQEQLPVNVVFTPSDETVYSSALDIHDTMHSKKYRVCVLMVLMIVFDHCSSYRVRVAMSTCAV